MMVNNAKKPKTAGYNQVVVFVKMLTLFLMVSVVPRAGAQVSTAGQNSFLPELEVIEFSESFKAGSVGNAVIFRIENTTAFPVVGLNLRPQLPAQYLILDRIDPNDVNLEPGEVVEITAEFSVREDAEVGAEDEIGFFFDTVSEYLLPVHRYRLIAVIDEGDVGAQCNSAVEAGGDAGGGVTVDLGGFVGLAGFSWEMFSIKDQMNVTVGGVQKTTGCVSNSGTFEINIPPGAATATVVVVPNCEQTSGTQWNFTFECPLSSDVTADGAGNDLTTANNGSANANGAAQGQPGGLAPTAVGAPVTPAPPGPPVQGPTGVRVAEAEANDSVASATAITIGDQVNGIIDRYSDGDFYIATLSHQGQLTVSFSRIPANINIAFRVLDEAGRQIKGWQTAPDTGAPYSAWADIKAPGRYVIEVRDGSNNAFAPEGYAMTTTLIPTADPAEPNDSLITATPLGWNQAMGSNILPLGDVDYFRVEASRQGQITISFTAAPGALNMAYRVLDTAGRQVKGWQTASADGASFQAIADIPSPGSYFIEVRDGSNNARSAAPYEIVASLNPTLDMAEPNNALGQATRVGMGAQVWASILPLGDVDYYQVEAVHQGQLTVAFNRSPADLNMAFRVLDDQGRQVRNWQTAPDIGENFTAWADIKIPGTYFVEVRDGSNNARAAEPYGMVITFIPTADPAEVNDSIQNATALPLNQPMQASILPLGDVDYYALNISHQGELTVDFTASPANLNMAFRVLDRQGRQVRNWQSAPNIGAPFSAWADLASPGEYLIEVRDGSNNARAQDGYTFSARLKATLDPLEPNNALEHATPLMPATRVNASILPIGDVDYYAISANQHGVLSVQFSDSPRNLNMAFRVLDGQGRQIKSWQTAPSDGASFTASAELPAAGRYLIEVRDGSNNARSADPYAISYWIS